MKIISRYIFLELIPPFFLGLFVFTFVMLTNALIRLLDLFITKGVGFGMTMKILGLSIPFLLVMTIPMSLLLAVLSAFSRFSSDSEITAMKASGISIHRMMPPVILLAFLTYAVSSFIYIGVLPNTNLMLKQLRYDIIRTKASVGIKPHVFNTDFIHLVIYINESLQNPDIMKGIFIADNRNLEQPIIIVAKTGKEIINPKSNTVGLRLEHGCSHELLKGKRFRYSTTPFDTMDLNLDMSIFQQSTVAKSDREMTIEELLQKAKDNEQHGRKSNSQWVEIWKKTSLPFACFIFALLGVPLGITTPRGSKSASFATSIGLILVYYILLTGGTGLADKGILSPFLATWAPNFLLGILGSYFYIRLAKESPSRIWKKISDTIVIKFIALSDKYRNQRAERSPTRHNQLLQLKFGRILDRYVTSLFLKIFFYVFLALLSISLIVHAFEKIENLVANQASLMDAIIAIGFKLPYFGILSIHFATLVASILTIGALNKTSELTAMKASGISYLRIITPLIAMGFVISGITFFFNESVIPICNRKVEQAWDRIKKKERTRFMKYHRWYRGKNGDIYFFQHFDPERKVISEFSQFKLNDQMSILNRIETERMFWDGSNWIGDNTRIIDMSADCQMVKDESIPEYLNPLPETPADFSKEYKDSDEMNIRELRDYIEGLKSIGFDTIEYEVDWHAKFSIPFLSVIMVLIGTTFSSQNPRSSGGLVGIGTAIFIGAIYFVIFRISLELGQANKLPPILSAWICNIVFLCIGSYALLHVVKRT